MKQTTTYRREQKILHWVTALVLALFVAGCAGTANVLRSGNPSLIYDKAMEFYSKEKWARASDLFEGVHHYYQGTPREDSILFFNARCKYKDRDYETAVELLDQFRRRFGRSAFIEDAEGMHAMCYYYLSPGPKRDQTITSQAIIAITEFISHYPNSDRTPQFREIMQELTERLHEKAYINAYTYYKIGRYNAAIIAFRNALKMYSETHRREDLLYHIAMASFKLAENSVEEKRLDRYMSTLDAYYSFVMEYPESKYSKEMEQVAETAKRYIEKNKQGE